MPRDVVEESVVELPAEPASPLVRVRPDHVDVADRRIVGADEADEEPDQSAIGPFDDPRGSGEMLEPQSRQELVDPPAAPPLVDARHDRRVVRLGRPAEARFVGVARCPAHRDPTRAPAAAATTSSATSGPWTSRRYATGSRTPPSSR